MPQEASWSGTPSIKGSSEALRMTLLTFSMIGISLTWGVEMTYGTPYLLSLGLTKSKTSAVWVAGPLSGIIVQPIVGAIADRSTSKWGRRRPFMIGGSLFVSACLLVLAWAAEIVGLFNKNPDSAGFWAIVVAVSMIYAVDFSINAVMAAGRSLIVDTLPIAKQQSGSAWASRLGNIGSLLGYAIGTLNLPGIWGTWLGDSQFKQLCVLAALILTGTNGLTAWATTERILISPKVDEKGSGPLRVLIELFKTSFHLPNRIQAICWVQFWAWIGWFSFLFYSPTWVGETYFRYTDPEKLHDITDRLGAIGRIGSLSLVIFSIISFVASVILPPLIRSPDSDSNPKLLSSKSSPLPSFLITGLRYLNDRKPSLLTAWLVSHLIFAGANLLAPFVTSLELATIVVSLSGIPWALAMWAPFAFMGVEINRLTTPEAANAVAADGTALSNADGAAYHRARDEDDDDVDTDPTDPESKLAHSPPPASPVELHINNNHAPLHSPNESNDADDEADTPLTDEDDPDLELNLSHATGTNGFLTAEDPLAADASTGETAGVYLGILNLYAAAPQLLGTLINFIVFAIVEPGKSRELAGESSLPVHSHNDSSMDGIFGGGVGVGNATDPGGGERVRLVRGVLEGALLMTRDHADEGVPQGWNAIGVCMFIGGLSSLGAAYATWKLKFVR